MLKRIIKALLGQSKHKRNMYTSDAWKKGMKSHRQSHLGHHHYKRKHKSNSIFSSFFSS